ncbi:TPA: hypothetical protein I8617_005386, partial [Citrobacter amalonaticus]|nr:hypothetical protein [Citrobacter amalonaticus]
LNKSGNITNLPTSTSIDPDRTVHRGMHNNDYDISVRDRLTEINNLNASTEIKSMHIDALSDDLGHQMRNKHIKLNNAC